MLTFNIKTDKVVKNAYTVQCTPPIANFMCDIVSFSTSAADDVRILDFDLLVPFDLIDAKSVTTTVYRSDAEQSWKQNLAVYRQREAEYWSVRIANYTIV